MEASKQPQTQGKLVLVIGPSGVGKSAILKRLREAHPEFHFPRSATTRARREGEGTDPYHFVSNSEFDQLIAENKVLEWAVVHGSDRYGTIVSEIIPYIEQGHIVVREVDVQGFDSIRQHPLFAGAEAPYRLQSIFILPETREQLIARTRHRAPISDDELARRIQSMDHELAYADHCTARVLNRDGQLGETVQEVEQLIAQ